ncbi:MAG: CRTAC1 family protein [Planctomycetes bacterium]|nr:CRTAC1 family protein [Planctomycetota bacterium]
MPRPLQLALALLVLAAAALTGRWLLRAERGAPPPPPPRVPADGEPEAPPVLEGIPLRGPLPPLPIRWTEVDPAAAGVGFVHTWGGGPMDNLVKASGGGLALFDFDGDGDDDLYMVQGAFDPVAAPPLDPREVPPDPPRNRLYRNEGGWRFTDATEESGLGDAGYGMGAAPADYDGDGDLDLFVANFGPDRLYRNDGGRFTDVTGASGIETPGFSVGGAWGDADGDGILDLLVCGYVVFDRAAKPGGPNEPFPGPQAYRGEPTRLLLGRGDGTFRDATLEGGLWSTEGRGMAVAFSDLDGNGSQEILVSNDAAPNFVFERRGERKWVEVGFPLGLALSDLGQARSSMGLGIADFDLDGRPDVAVPDGSGGALYRNRRGRFEDRARTSGIDGAMGGRTGWSAAPVDFDLDGWPDLVITCGALHALEPQAPVLFRNLGDGRFEDASEATGFGRVVTGRACGVSDLDGDGDPDLVLAALGARPLLLRNDGGEARRSLLVRCRGKGGNRDALGAVVEVEAGGLSRREEVRTTQGYLTGTSPTLLFGLGGAAAADRVRVKFPSGAVRILENVPAGRVVVDE